jgi:hypothetical protein
MSTTLGPGEERLRSSSSTYVRPQPTKSLEYFDDNTPFDEFGRDLE